MQMDEEETSSCSIAISKLKTDLVFFLTRDPYVIKWSLWWALAMCGHFQVVNYIQPLWETIKPSSEGDNKVLYNGLVEACTTITGALLTFLFGFLRINWRLVGEVVLFLVAFADGAILMAMGQTEDLMMAYIGYWLYKIFYFFLIAVASFEISQNISQNSYGLAFGINTFVALVFQTILTLVVADDTGLALDPKEQFSAYGYYWIMNGGIFFVIFIASNLLHPSGRSAYVSHYRQNGLWLAEPTSATAAPPPQPANNTSEKHDSMAAAGSWRRLSRLSIMESGC